jgi:hypothetical protein
VGVDGAEADVQRLGHILRAVATGKEVQDLALALAQPPVDLAALLFVDERA